VNVREAQYAIETQIHRLAVIEDLLAHLDGKPIPSPVGDGMVPDEHTRYVRSLLEKEQRACEAEVRDLEELNVGEPKQGKLVVLDGHRRPDP